MKGQGWSQGVNELSFLLKEAVSGRLGQVGDDRDFLYIYI